MPKIVVDVNQQRAESIASDLGQVPGYEGQQGYYFRFRTQAIEGGGINIESVRPPTPTPGGSTGGLQSTDGGQGGSGQGSPPIGGGNQTGPQPDPGNQNPAENGTPVSSGSTPVGSGSTPVGSGGNLPSVLKPPPSDPQATPSDPQTNQKLDALIDAIGKLTEKLETVSTEPPAEPPAAAPQRGSIRIPVTARVIQTKPQGG